MQAKLKPFFNKQLILNKMKAIKWIHLKAAAIRRETYHVSEDPVVTHPK